MTEATCGEHIPHLLRAYGVTAVFGMPGVHSLELYRTLADAGIAHIGVRHEQGAGFMADGYARSSRRPGVALVISGPGVTNAATAIGQAYSDSVPVLMLSATIATCAMGMDRGMLHEISDQRAVTAPLAGLSMTTLRPEQLPEQLSRIFSRFAAQRPRPCHLSVPLDVLEMSLEHARNGRTLASRPGPAPLAVERLAAMITGARRPLVLAGGGAVEAADALLALIERTGALFVSTVAGKGIIPESHPQSLGSTLQRLRTRQAVAEADLVLAVGTEIAEPDLYITADAEAVGALDPELLQPKLTIRGAFARIDLDSDVVVRDYDPAVAIVSDAALAIRALVDALPDSLRPPGDTPSRAAEIREANGRARSALERLHDVVLGSVRRALPDDALVYADMTQIAYTGCLTFPTERPGCWHFPMGFGTLGFALPAAIGGKIACPDRAVIALVGDGGFQFTGAELATAVEHTLCLPILVWDNDALGEIADFMSARRIPAVDVYPVHPDFQALAAAYRCAYARASTPEAIESAVRAALQAPGPTLIHVRQAEVAAHAPS